MLRDGSQTGGDGPGMAPAERCCTAPARRT